MTLRKVKDFKEILLPPLIRPFNKRHIFSRGKYWVPKRRVIKIDRKKRKWVEPKYTATVEYAGLTPEQYIRLHDKVMDDLAEIMLPRILKSMEEEQRKELQNQRSAD